MSWLELLEEDLYKFFGPSGGFWTVHFDSVVGNFAPG